MRATALLLVAAWLTGTGTATAGAFTSEDPHAWLERMGAAMSQMDYQGTFVYVQGDEVVTMRITHMADDDGVRERLVAMSGSPREILRDSDGVRWVVGDDHSVLKDPAFSRSFFPQLPLDLKDQADRSYQLKLGGVGRIAAQSVRRLDIIPRDDYRYGYSLWLEEHSALLLKWQLLAPDGQSLAKLMFTDFRMGSEVDPSELVSSSALRKFKTVESRLPGGRSDPREAPRWKPLRLPPGFELTDHRYYSLKQPSGDDPAQAAGAFEHLVYSDGIAAVSVYIESGEEEPDSKIRVKRLGTTHAFSHSSDGVLVTVVGDVPEATVRLIGGAVGPVAE